MPLEDKRVPEVTWPLAEGCFCGLEAGGLAEVGRGRRAYKNGQHVPRKELVPCPSSKEGPSSESTLPFLAFSFTTRAAVRSFPVRPVASLLAYRAQTAPAPSTGTCTCLDALDCRERDFTSTDGLDTHIHDQIFEIGHPTLPFQILHRADLLVRSDRDQAGSVFWLRPGSFGSQESSSPGCSSWLLAKQPSQRGLG